VAPAAAAVLAAVLVVLGSACRDLGPNSSDLLDDILLHRSIWESRRPAAYGVELERFCTGCTAEERGPVRLRVEGTTVMERHYTASGDPVPGSLVSVFPSVEGLFDLLEDAARRDIWYMNISWDSELSYPRDLYVDYDSNRTGDEVSYRVEVILGPDGGT
jgi:hypothetical protein